MKDFLMAVPLPWRVLAAAVIDTILAWWAIGLFLEWVRSFKDKSGLPIGAPDEKNTVRSFDFVFGTAERSIATCLFIWAPGYLGAFIGGWIALKYGANWKTFTDTKES